jgi:hypothetical protein
LTYCVTAGKTGINGENKSQPVVLGETGLLESKTKKSAVEQAQRMVDEDMPPFIHAA